MARVRAGTFVRERRFVRFVEVPTAPLIKLEVDDGRSVAGAFVKLAPRLRRSERASFDAAAAVRALAARGAVAVVVAPVIIPDDVERRPSAGRVDARGEVLAWFGEQMSEDAVEAAKQCMRILDEVGL